MSARSSCFECCSHRCCSCGHPCCSSTLLPAVLLPMPLCTSPLALWNPGSWVACPDLRLQGGAGDAAGGPLGMRLRTRGKVNEVGAAGRGCVKDVHRPLLDESTNCFGVCPVWQPMPHNLWRILRPPAQPTARRSCCACSSRCSADRGLWGLQAAACSCAMAGAVTGSRPGRLGKKVLCNLKMLSAVLCSPSLQHH